MLRATHRVLKPGGVVAFFVIAVRGDASGQDRCDAITAGPPFVETEASYPHLLDAAGFDVADVIDLTAAFRATLSTWWEGWDAAAVELTRIVGEEVFVERQSKRIRAIGVVDAGLLCRYLISATRR